jgi:hypothetical protein
MRKAVVAAAVATLVARQKRHWLDRWERMRIARERIPSKPSRTCLALIEIVHSCNLSCPTCYANSPLEKHRVDAVPLTEVQRRVQGVIDRKGKIEILQLSGGEPTLHPQLFELLDWAHQHPKIEYLLLNTNGVSPRQEGNFAAGWAASLPGGTPDLSPIRRSCRPAGQDWLRAERTCGASAVREALRCLRRRANLAGFTLA